MLPSQAFPPLIPKKSLLMLNILYLIQLHMSRFLSVCPLAKLNASCVARGVYQKSRAFLPCGKPQGWESEARKSTSNYLGLATFDMSSPGWKHCIYLHMCYEEEKAMPLLFIHLGCAPRLV